MSEAGGVSGRIARGSRRGPWGALGVLILAAGMATPAQGRDLPGLEAKLDQALLAAARSGGPVAVAAWVVFADKGERGPSDLVSRLARAEASLTSRNRARRQRAGVWPLVDYRDLPVSDAYLRELDLRGLRAVAYSRWLNRAAYRIPADRLFEVAGLPFVQRIVPVQRALLSIEAGSETPEADAWPPERGPGGGRLEPPRQLPAPSGTAIDYGRTRDPLTQLNLPAVHDSGFTGSGVLVCLLDAGFNYHDRHEALRDQIISPGHRRDFVEGDTIVTDTTNVDFSHGTWVLGCIAGNKPGDYVGAAFGAEFALARTENEASETPVEMLYWGMGAEWADSLGADIISSSVGYYTFDGGVGDYTYEDMDGHTTDVTRAAQIAASKGILVVTAVGNLGADEWRHMVAPADAHGDSVVAVGSVAANGDTVRSSSAGPTADGRIKPDLVARGASAPVISASGSPGGYTILSGTSFATPFVSGLAACLMQARPSWTPTEVIRAMKESASNALRPDNKRGHGIPNGLAVLRGVTTDVPARAPGTLTLRLVGPNPLRLGGPSALVRFALGHDAHGTIEGRISVLDAQGREVRDLWSGPLGLGEWRNAEWDGRDRDGRAVTPGVYWIALVGDGASTAVRVVSLR